MVASELECVSIQLHSGDCGVFGGELTTGIDVRESLITFIVWSSHSSGESHDQAVRIVRHALLAAELITLREGGSIETTYDRVRQVGDSTSRANEDDAQRLTNELAVAGSAPGWFLRIG